MSIKFIWDEKYTVGDPDIDKEHKSMFDMANSISDDIDEEEIKRIIKQLFNYTHEHFTNEEEMMKKLEYQKLAEHRIHHQILITKLHKMHIRTFDDDKSKFIFRKFICDWMLDHIMNHDKDFFYFVQEKNIDNSKNTV